MALKNGKIDWKNKTDADLLGSVRTAQKMIGESDSPTASAWERSRYAARMDLAKDGMREVARRRLLHAL